ncbi:MAG: hypothetical protein WC517_01340 [Patescibacteria group bacterium]
MLSYLQGIIIRTEGDFAVIKIMGDQELYWPKKSINFNYAEGETVNLGLFKEEPAPERNEEKAKVILRQIFQPNA